MHKSRVDFELINDRHEGIVSVFRCLQNNELAEQLRQACFFTPFARTEFETARIEPTDSIVEKARKTVFRAAAGFGAGGANQELSTGFRAYSRNARTSPAMDWANWPQYLPQFIERLRGVVIENRDAAAIIAEQDSADVLFYIDPPYLTQTRTKKRVYDFEMTDDQHETLLRQLKSVSGMVALSGYASELYQDYLGDWRRIDFKTVADRQAERTECLWLNPQSIMVAPRLFI